MYKDEIEKYTQLTIDNIINSAKKLLPEPYCYRPWSHPELKHGVALLETEDGLNSYLAAYGLAHKLKVVKALESLQFSELDQTIEVFAWGCGQGLASV